MMVVGVGCGPGMMTVEAIDRLRKASKIFGSARSIELAGEYIPSGCAVTAIEDYSRLHELPEDAVVLSTGDPMLAGLGLLGGGGRTGHIIDAMRVLPTAPAPYAGSGGGRSRQGCRSSDDRDAGRVGKGTDPLRAHRARFRPGCADRHDDEAGHRMHHGPVRGAWVPEREYIVRQCRTPAHGILSPLLIDPR